MSEPTIQELYCSLPMAMDQHQVTAIAAVRHDETGWMPLLILRRLLWVVDGPVSKIVLAPHGMWELRTSNLEVTEERAGLLALFAVLDGIRRFQNLPKEGSQP